MEFDLMIDLITGNGVEIEICSCKKISNGVVYQGQIC
jgi:hypothetical protein